MSKHLRMIGAAWHWLLVASVFAAALAYSIWFSDLEPQWPDPEIHRVATALPMTGVTPNRVVLSQYAAVWQSPLFSRNRQPDSHHQGKPAVPPTPPLGGFTLTGIVVAGDIRIAMLKGPNNEDGTYHEGQTLPNGWSLVHVSERMIELRYGPALQTLELVIPRLPMTQP